MSCIGLDQRPALSAALLAGGTVAVPVLLWGADGPLSRWSGLDLSFLALPVLLVGVSLTLAAFTQSSTGKQLAARAGLHQEAALSSSHRLLTDLSWMALVLGLMSSLSTWPDLTSEQRSVASHYLGAFDALAYWGVLILAPFIAGRAIALFRPSVGTIIGFPWTRLAAFGLAYALVGRDGALSAAFGMSGTWPLLAFAVALMLSHTASAVRRAMESTPPERVPRLQRALYLIDAAWPLVLWLSILLLIRGAESAASVAVELGPAAVDASYLEVLRTLTVAETLMMALPFLLIHYVRLLWPGMRHVVHAPIWYLAALAAAYIAFSGSGMLATAFAVDFSAMLTAVVGVASLAYVAVALHNLAKIESRRRYAQAAKIACRVLSALAAAAGVGLFVGAALDHLPAATTVLLQRPSTLDFWEGVLPIVAGLYEVRYPITGLSAASTAVFFMIRAIGSGIASRYRDMLTIASCVVGGCLIWLIASSLAEFGHGFPLAGAVATAGMFSLALTRLAGYAASSANPTVAELAGWLSASWLRSFVLGASLVCYALLLRPAVYQVAALAALFEYLALLALMLVVLLRVVNRLRNVVRTTVPTAPAWFDWRHHLGTAEGKPDPRAEQTDMMQRQYLEFGDWRPMWIYLLMLLYQSGASLDVMVAVCRSLRRGVATPFAWRILYSSRAWSARAAALHDALNAVGQAVADPTGQIERFDEAEVRRLAAPYVENGTGTESLVTALIVARCQRGDDLQESADRWFPLLDTPPTLLVWLDELRGGASSGPRTRQQRLDLLNSAIASLFGDASRESATASPATLGPNVVSINT